MTKFVVILALVLSFSSVPAARADDPNVTRIMGLWVAIQAQIAGIQADEPAMEAAYSSYEGWWSQAQAYPTVFAPLQQQALTAIVAQLNAIISADYSECVALKDAEQIGKMRHAIRWAATKADLIPFVLTQIAALDGMLQKCAHFKLKFNSKFTAAGNAGDVIVETKAEFPLSTYSINGNLTLSGYGVLDYVQVKWPSPAGCSLIGMGTGGPMSVESASFQFTDASSGDLMTDFKMDLSVPNTSEQIAIRCPNYNTSIAQSTWSLSWRGFHMAEESHVDASIFTLANWTLTQAGEEIATKLYHGAHGAVSEDTKVTVTFDPQ